MPIGDRGATRARIGAALLTLVVFAGSASALVASAAAEPAPVPLLESSPCPSAQADPPEPGPAVLAGGGAAVPLVVSIPPTTFVRLDGSGTPTEVMTNTGCAPRATDRWLVERDGRGDGIVPAPVIASLLDQPATGDWRQPGVWHPAA